jgi:hypothetical protein
VCWGVLECARVCRKRCVLGRRLGAGQSGGRMGVWHVDCSAKRLHFEAWCDAARMRVLNVSQRAARKPGC